MFVSYDFRDHPLGQQGTKGWDPLIVSQPKQCLFLNTETVTKHSLPMITCIWRHQHTQEQTYMFQINTLEWEQKNCYTIKILKWRATITAVVVQTRSFQLGIEERRTKSLPCEAAILHILSEGFLFVNKLLISPFHHLTVYRKMANLLHRQNHCSFTVRVSSQCK